MVNTPIKIDLFLNSTNKKKGKHSACVLFVNNEQQVTDTIVMQNGSYSIGMLLLIIRQVERFQKIGMSTGFVLNIRIHIKSKTFQKIIQRLVNLKSFVSATNCNDGLDTFKTMKDKLDMARRCLVSPRYREPASIELQLQLIEKLLSSTNVVLTQEPILTSTDEYITVKKLSEALYDQYEQQGEEVKSNVIQFPQKM